MALKEELASRFGNSAAFRLLGFVALIVVLQMAGHLMVPSKGGTFSSTAKPTHHAMASTELPDEDSAWGNSTKGSGTSANEALARAAAARRQRALNHDGDPSSSETKVYDPHADGGWGN